MGVQKDITVFCPATIANISCGFDILGIALDSVGDYMTVSLSDQPGIRIPEIKGQNLPLDPDKNVAGVAAKAFINALGKDHGVTIRIDKRIKAGSGIGSSAASSAGVVWALNELTGSPFNMKELTEFAMKGEELASGSAHADNVAPALFGGITLVRSYEPLDIIKLPTPSELFACILHPQIEIKTEDSRKILKTTITLKQGVRQWGNVGGLVAGLFTEDYQLISRSLEDHIVEPVRSLLIPGFEILKEAAMGAGALGFGISGSGPSVFALCQGSRDASTVAHALKSSYAPIGIPFEVYESAINLEGVRIQEPPN